VSLTVGGGEIVTLLGANGSGKSTTLRAISGLVRPAAGRIGWEARDVLQETLAVIRRINAEGVSVRLVEQNARAALGVAARGYVLETGRVVAPGPSGTLAADARAARLSRFGSGRGLRL
jgi:ABC-type branched-subunit amino acid transport system ATPase component